jgi:hypothetical protein
VRQNFGVSVIKIPRTRRVLAESGDFGAVFSGADRNFPKCFAKIFFGKAFVFEGLPGNCFESQVAVTLGES